MQLASFLNKVFKKDGFILIDADSKKYIMKHKCIYFNSWNFYGYMSYLRSGVIQCAAVSTYHLLIIDPAHK